MSNLHQTNTSPIYDGESDVRYQPNVRAIFGFEEEFDYQKVTCWFNQNWSSLLCGVPIYFLVVFGLQAFMKDRKRLEVRRSLIIWNSTLCIFSLLVFLRTFPELMYTLKEFGFQYSICVPSFIERNKVTGVWSVLFSLSKAMELGDTIFIVLRKNKLIFLHIYHHTIIYVLCAVGTSEYPACARYFVVLNSFVHTLMYGYYALRAAHVKVPEIVSMLLTTIQIAQMTVGVAVAVSIIHFKLDGFRCHVNMKIIVTYALVAFSFLVLFCNYFLQTYLKKSRNQIKKSN